METEGVRKEDVEPVSLGRFASGAPVVALGLVTPVPVLLTADEVKVEVAVVFLTVEAVVVPVVAVVRLERGAFVAVIVALDAGLRGILLTPVMLRAVLGAAFSYIGFVCNVCE